MKKYILLLPVWLMSGCALVTPHPTSMTLSPQAMEIVGPASGESVSTRLLCVIPVSGASASLAAATENALKAVEAEAIVNPMVDDERGIGILGLWCWQKIRVSGTAIRFKRNAASQTPAAGDKRGDRGQATNAPKVSGGIEPTLDKSDADAISDMEKRLFKK